MLFDSAKNGPSTAIWVACAFIARILASAKSLPSTTAESSSSGTMNGGSGPSGSMPSNDVVSPAARSARSPSRIRYTDIAPQ